MRAEQDNDIPVVYDAFAAHFDMEATFAVAFLLAFRHFCPQVLFPIGRETNMQPHAVIGGYVVRKVPTVCFQIAFPHLFVFGEGRRKRTGGRGVEGIQLYDETSAT